MAQDTTSCGTAHVMLRTHGRHPRGPISGELAATEFGGRVLTQHYKYSDLPLEDRRCVSAALWGACGPRPITHAVTKPMCALHCTLGPPTEPRRVDYIGVRGSSCVRVNAWAPTGLPAAAAPAAASAPVPERCGDSASVWRARARIASKIATEEGGSDACDAPSGCKGDAIAAGAGLGECTTLAAGAVRCTLRAAATFAEEPAGLEVARPAG